MPLVNAAKIAAEVDDSPAGSPDPPEVLNSWFVRMARVVPVTHVPEYSKLCVRVPRLVDGRDL